jgi:hypothetical protein
MGLLAGKVSLITGTSWGIGVAIQLLDSLRDKQPASRCTAGTPQLPRTGLSKNSLRYSFENSCFTLGNPHK